MTDEDRAMTVRELRAALASLEANSDVQVVLFKNDGTSQVFELEEVLSNNGHTQLEIYEAEPMREENPEG
jgi:enoyl-CoA hydratase/carnithine racemase